jgi:arginyl-tRNA--protein-N-Asp/Glu arginylyltransferase
MSYLSWHESSTNDFSDSNINSLYNDGFLFTRTGHGDMYQTRSLRIDLSKFELSSENRRVLKKTDSLLLTPYSLPLANYDWHIGKMAKDFYEKKFGAGTFSANKIKELLTTEHNFNKLFEYKVTSNSELVTSNNIGYTICFESNEILHYSYPFYELQVTSYKLQNIGIGMMLRAILYAQEQGKKYVYLGSAKDEKAKYKLQFEGLEWFDAKKWSGDLEELKQLLNSTQI